MKSQSVKINIYLEELGIHGTTNKVDLTPHHISIVFTHT